MKSSHTCAPKSPEIEEEKHFPHDLYEALILSMFSQHLPDPSMVQEERQKV